MRDLVRGKRWLLLTSGLNLDRGQRRQLNTLFALHRRILKAYPLKESLGQLWNYTRTVLAARQTAAPPVVPLRSHRLAQPLPQSAC